MKKYLISILFFSFHVFAQAQDFISRWDLSIAGSGPTQISFGVSTTGPCSYTWETIPAGMNGSGIFNGATITITGLPANAMIRVKIAPTNFDRIIINNCSDRNRLMDVEQWGAVTWSSMQHAFHGCNNLNCTAIDIPDLTGVTDMSFMFDSCLVLNGPGNINSWNTSSVTNMQELFNRAGLFNQPVGNWNTANVTNMRATFRDAGAFNQPLANWNTANVTDMWAMFNFTINFNQPIGNWNTGNVTDMGGMFAHSAFNQAIGNWNTGNVLGMSSMFAFNYFFNQPIGSWNTANVKDMSFMFDYNAVFNQAIGNWNTANVKWMNCMFMYSAAFNQPIGNWNTTKVTSMESMFRGATSFNQGLGFWQLDSNVQMANMFQGATSFNQAVGNWQLNQNVTMTNMLDYSGMDCSNYSNTLSGWANNVNVPSNRNLGSDNLKYALIAQNDRNYLINTKGWTIVGDVLDINCCVTQYFTLNDTACFSYFFNGQTLTNNGTYYDTLVNANGCDSIITLNLFFSPPNIGVSQSGVVLTANATGATYQWLTCEPFQLIPGATNQSYTATANGNYAVIITQHGCVDTSLCYPVMGIGLNNYDLSNNIKIFPNPVNQILQIEAEQSLQHAEINVLNTLGQTIASFKNISARTWSLDMSAYAKGNYFIRIKDAKNSIVKKVIKD